MPQAVTLAKTFSRFAFATHLRSLISSVSMARRLLSTMADKVVASPGSRSPPATACRMALCAALTPSAVLVSGRSTLIGRSFAGGISRSRMIFAAVKSPALAASITALVISSAPPCISASSSCVDLLRVPAGLPLRLPDCPGLKALLGACRLVAILCFQCDCSDRYRGRPVRPAPAIPATKPPQSCDTSPRLQRLLLSPSQSAPASCGAGPRSPSTPARLKLKPWTESWAVASCPLLLTTSAALLLEPAIS